MCYRESRHLPSVPNSQKRTWRIFSVSHFKSIPCKWKPLTRKPAISSSQTVPSSHTCTFIYHANQLEPQPSLSLFQLLLHVDAGSLPQDLGGALDYDHQDWLTKCNQVAELQVRSRRKFFIIPDMTCVFVDGLHADHDTLHLRDEVTPGQSQPSWPGDHNTLTMICS